MTFTFYRQLNQMDCEPTCIRMIAKYYGKHYNASSLRNLAGFNRSGVSLLGLSTTAEHLGFRTRGVRLTFEQLSSEAPLPCILHWDKNHFVVLVEIKKNHVKIANPASNNMITYQKKNFCTIDYPGNPVIRETT